MLTISEGLFKLLNNLRVARWLWQHHLRKSLSLILVARNVVVEPILYFYRLMEAVELHVVILITTTLCILLGSEGIKIVGRPSSHLLCLTYLLCLIALICD